MRWSVTLQAVGDRVLTREEVVELADAVAPHAGVASGIGTKRSLIIPITSLSRFIIIVGSSAWLKAKRSMTTWKGSWRQVR